MTDFESQKIFKKYFIIFGGDTAYHELFKPLKEENIEVAIMPIGAYQP